MNDEQNFEQIRRNAESNQKAILWEDQLRNGRSIDAFLWKGDPHARPVQRAGLVIFALTFLIFAVCFFLIGIEKKAVNDKTFYFCFTFLIFLLSGRLMRNAFLRAPKDHDD